MVFSMLKWIFRLLFVLLILVVATVSAVYVKRAQLLAAVLTSAAGVPVKIAKIDVTKAGGTIHGLRIKNPPGCVLKNAFSANKVDLTFKWIDFVEGLLSNGKKKAVFDKVEIEKSRMGIELFSVSGEDSNWGRIVTQLAAPSQTVSFTFDFMVRKFVMKEIQLHVQY